MAHPEDEYMYFSQILEQLKRIADILEKEAAAWAEWRKEILTFYAVR